MVKTYLRYALSASHGIITSPTCNIAVDATGGTLFTGALESVGVWSVKRGVEVRVSRLAGAARRASAAGAAISAASSQSEQQ